MLVFEKKTPQLLIAGAIALGILTLGACGGGGSSISPVAKPNPPGVPQSGTATIAVNPAGMTASIPAVAGFTESITLPANNAAAGTNLQLTITSTAPSGMPALDPDMHVAIPFLYFALRSTKAVTLNGFPGFKLTIPAGFNIGNTPVKIGYYDPATGWTHVGNMVLSGSTITFAPISAPFTFRANVTYYVLPYTCGGPSPSPTPTPQCTTVPLAAATQLPIPAVGGFDGTWVAGSNNAPSGTTVTLTSYLGAPTGAPSPVAAIRKAGNTIDVVPLLAKAPSAAFSVSIKFSTHASKSNATTSSTITFAKFPAVAFDLPTGYDTNGVIFKLETFDFTTGALLDSETGTRSGSEPVVESFPGTASPFVADTGHTYLWELVVEPLPTPPVGLYVTNAGNRTITAYDQNGNQITTSGTFPNLTNPVGIAFDSLNNHLYVGNQANNTIREYDLNGNQITPSGTFPNLETPIGIAFDSSNDHLYVANFGNNTITVYDLNGNQITPSGNFPNLNGPDDIAFDSSNGHLYVVNGGPSNTITVYDQNGNQITTSGTFPNLNFPYGIAFDSSNDHLYVTNGSAPLSVYDQNGNQITTSGTFPNLKGPRSIVFDSSNSNLYVTNHDNNTITAYDQNGNQISTSGTFPNLDGSFGLTFVP